VSQWLANQNTAIHGSQSTSREKNFLMCKLIREETNYDVLQCGLRGHANFARDTVISSVAVMPCQALGLEP
jgi:hypothetical protein